MQKKKETQKEKKNIHKKEKIEKKTVKENSKKVRKEKLPEKKEEKKEEKIVKTVNIKPEELKLDILAKKMNVPVSKIIKDQFMKGLILRPGQSLSLEDAINLSEKLRL